MVGRKSVWGVLLVAVVVSAMFAFTGTAFAVENPECLSCHPIGATYAWDIPDVDRATACSKCHTPGLLGTHPFHNAGGDCGSVCHKVQGWGNSNAYAIPAWVGAQGSFNSSASVDTSPALLHVIHSNPRWPATAASGSQACGSCHAAAACEACHAGAIADRHGLHSSVGDAELGYSARAPWTGTVGYGVVGGDLSLATKTELTSQCQTPECHSVASMVALNPVQHESHSHGPVAASPVTDVVTYSPLAWKVVAASNYSLGRIMVDYRVNQTLTTTLTGSTIDVVGQTDPYSGLAEVWIDGVKKATIDMYAPTTTYQKVVFRSGTLANTAHRVQIKVLAQKGGGGVSRAAYVYIDGFRVYGALPSSFAPQCATTCHADRTAQHGFTYSHDASQGAFASTYSGFACSSCHASYMVDEHRRTSSTSKAANCAACHDSYVTMTMEFPDGNISCTQVGTSGFDCHNVANAEEPHRSQAASHTVGAESADLICQGCHTGALDVIHNNSIAGNDIPTDCLTCHGTNVMPATNSCTSGCHVASGVDDMDSHPYVSASHLGSGLDAGVANTGGRACNTCHEATLELGPEHSRSSSKQAGGASITCTTCHAKAYLPRPWSDTCVECHATGKAPVPHGDYTARHDFSAYAAANVTGCGGATCHDVTMADVIHDESGPGNGSCASCHVPGGGVPTKHLCTDCHTSHTMATAHNAGAYTDGLGCAVNGCHDGFATISTAHPGGCVTCHDTTTGELTDYLSGAVGVNDRYTASCTSCHTDTMGASGAAVLGKLYKPWDANHYTGTELTHTVSAAQQAQTYDYDGAGSAYAPITCPTCHFTEMKPEHIAKTYTNFVGVPGTYVDKCIACHEQKVDNFAGAWNDTCTACHATKHGAVSTMHNATNVIVTGKGTAAGTTCGGVGCHDVTNIQAIHNNSVTSNDTSGAAYVTDCNNTCHLAPALLVQAKADCGLAACHGGMPDHNADHAPAANIPCGGCHESPDVKVVHGGASYCVVCHDNPSYPGIATTNTTQCMDCHNALEVFAKDYALPDAHYAGTESTHTSAGNGTYNTYACTQCHKMDLRDEHAKTSVAFPSFENTTTVVGKCTGCHELKVDFFVDPWDDKCASCHPLTHAERTAKHNASVSNPGCGGTGCHAVNDVAVIHNNSITTNSMYPSCVTCHASNDSVPAPIDCDSAGCHFGMEHGHSLNLSGSNYNNTTVTGCTNSGIGCHGSQATSPTPDYAIAQYHPDNGCQSGVCHTSASQANDAFNNPQTCQNCHGGRSVVPLMFEGAPDVIALTTATPGGHYNETTHTIVSVVQTMSVGGVSETTCVTCHRHVNPTGIDGEWYQHQVLQVYGNTTCVDCHSFQTPGDPFGSSRVGSLITSAVANGVHLDCIDCHNAGVMGVQYVMHEMNSSPPATATVASTPEFQCGDVGCHYDETQSVQLEIHYLHKGDGVIIPTWEDDGVTPYNPATCETGACHPNYPAFLPAGTGICDRRPEPQCVDCHDPLLQGWKPDEKSCGVNGDCHITSPHTSIGPAHSVTALSQACVDCHETTDLRSNHGYSDTENCSSDNMCHNLEGTQYQSEGTTYTFTLSGKKECADCHAVGKMPDVIRDHAPHDPNHYVGSETTHTATLQTGGFGAIYSVIATQGFDSATWPVAVSRSDGVNVVTSDVSPLQAGTHYAQISNSGSFWCTFDTSNVSSPTLEFYYSTSNLSGADVAKVEVSTNGSTFTQIWSRTANDAWTKVGPLALPRSATMTIRFTLSGDQVLDKFRVDSAVVKPGDATPVNCFLTCHYDELYPEHFKASAEATRVPGIYPDKCVDCHENRTDTFDVTRNFIDWDRTCVECHGDTKHYGQTARHDATLVRPDCGGSGCHYIKDVAVIHNNSALGNSWPSDPSLVCIVCHNSKLSTPQSLDCGSTGCHVGMVAHTHDLDYDGSIFNATTVTGCVQSGAGCHGNSTATNYAADYHAATGCTEGRCHRNAANDGPNPTQALPEFNNPNTCMNCHGGGTIAYDGATDRIPVAGASPNGHYPALNHGAAPASKTASATAGGTASARCEQCHNPVGVSGVDGLYPVHQGLTGLGNTSCVDCHNYNVGVISEVVGSWTTDNCSDCHNATDLPLYVAHSATAPAVTATEAQGAGTCQATGCHTSLDLHALHKNAAGGCAPVGGGCHDFTAQAYKPTGKSCGTGGTCHTTDPHDPAAHSIVDSANCTRCHEGINGTVATSIQSIYYSAGMGGTPVHTCATCHNGGSNLGATNTADCVDCHNATEAGTHIYTPYDPNHYYTASHDSSLTTGANWGTTDYGDELTDFHGTVFAYERGCTTCHVIDLKTEHDKTSVSFDLGGKNDKCQACHENKVDGWTSRWTGSCAGEASNCHNLTALHSDRSTKHDASTQVMSAPGSSYTLVSTAGEATENYGTTTTWPATWTRSSTTYVTVQTGSSRSGAAAQIGVNATRTEYTFYRTTAFDLSSYQSGNIQFWYQVNVSDTADYLICEYSTTSGTTGYTELFRVNTDTLTWTQSPQLTIPGGGSVWVRFRGTFNGTGEYGRVDDLVINGVASAAYGAALPAGSTAAASCQNNPNGTECHNVADVANIHSRTANAGCPICHTGTAQHPTQLNCQTTGCHAGVNVDNHNTAWHESTIGSNTSGAFNGTSFATAWCRGCHDDSIDNEHTVLGTYGTQPCSMCHKKASNSAAPISVTSATTSATIHADSTPGNVLCETCHTTVTSTRPHVQRWGWTGLPSGGSGAVGNLQFQTTWSGHRSFSAMPGSKTSFTTAVDSVAAARTWSLPTVANMMSNWSALTESTTMMVTCSDCHGDVSGATGPHGGSVTIGMASGYAKNYSNGTAYSNGSAPYIQPTTAGNIPICAKCHQTTGFNGMNDGHSGSSSHEGSTAGKCINCHIKIPHAWKRPRLLGYTTDPAPYASLRITSITDKAYTPTTWAESNCGVSGCGTHPATATTPLWP